jgi:hypothetical protein
MTTIECRTCKKDISFSAVTCPHCGDSFPTETTGFNFYWAFLRLFGITLACVFLDIIWLFLLDPGEAASMPITTFVFYDLPMWLYDLIGWWVLLVIAGLISTLFASR